MFHLAIGCMLHTDHCFFLNNIYPFDCLSNQKVLDQKYEHLRKWRCLIEYLHLACTGLLCVWLYATSLPDPPNCHHLCNYSWYIFLVKCRELSLAMDFILLCRLHCRLCVPLLYILLPHEDKDVGFFPDELLLRLHFDVLFGFRNPLWWVTMKLLCWKCTLLHLPSCLFCDFLFWYSGAVGYLGSTLFVRRIYRNIKCD